MVNAGVKRYHDLNARHLTVLDQAEVNAETIHLQAETLQSRVRIALAARTRLRRDGTPADAERQLVSEPGFVAHQLSFGLQEGQSATVEKIVALYTSRDRAVSESGDEARLTVTEAEDFELLARHVGAWSSLWNHATSSWTAPTSGPRRSAAHILHLLQTVSPHTVHLDVGVPARAGMGRPTAATSSGTRCSSSRS